MKFYNTLTRRLEDFTPLNDRTVRIYSCGPTVYDHAHIGNLSAYIFTDTLRRVLHSAGYPTVHAMNYTDVDDKTIRRSRELYPNDAPREALQKLTDRYIEQFRQDMGLVGNDLTGLTFLRATDPKVIKGMQGLISDLHKKGFAYNAEDGLYFSIKAYRQSGKTYGQLLEIDASNTSDARINNDEYDKQSIHDFALWKRRKPGEPAWPFNIDGQEMDGRPGWHIECSVMSRMALDQPFDIHTGGVDLIFPHHENEIAQSTAGAANPVMAQFFLHNEHMLVDGKKMSKSAKNFFIASDIASHGYNPLAFRLLVLQSHYRSQAHFSWDNLAAAQQRLDRWSHMAALQWQTANATGQSKEANIAVQKQQIEQAINQFDRALADDLNTPQALQQVDTALDSIETTGMHSSLQQPFITLLRRIRDVLGFDLSTPDITDEQKTVIRQREEARKDKNWKLADSLREQLSKQGIGLNDTPHGSVWYRL